MAVRPGEENVATLFGDVHYFYGPPTERPRHHRFDKGSYVYLFENANDRRARIEIANQPGTEDQDALDGFLDHTQVRYSYNQQVLVSITVDGVHGAPLDHDQWHLPTYDPRNENKYHYKLHSLDIYFWTQADALQFVNGVRRVLPPSQVDVLDEPGPPAHAPRAHSQDINPLVSRLEKAAISDSSRGTPNSQQGIPSFAPPPVSAVHGSSEPPPNFQPMAYNPAAPAAPEQVRHREKTPPPPEDDGYDPLKAAVVGDNAPPYTPGYGPNGPLSPGFPGPPTGAHPGVTSPGFPPAQFGHLQRSVTMPASGLASPGLASPYGSAFPGSPGFAPPPPPPPTTQLHPQPRPSPPLHTQSQPLQSPGLPLQSPGLPLQSPGLPPGGYANYSYSNPVGGGIPQGSGYDIHQQLYRPSEQEHMVKYKPKPDGRSKLGENADRLERGVTGMLKKFEKKFG
ncbi:RNA recognition motif-containing protein [Seiridium cupressi]